MSEPTPIAEPFQDTIPKVDGAIAVGEDLEFQQRWWRFETAAWYLLALLLVADALGAFGQGWLAHAHARTRNGALDVQYERIERAGTPSMLTIHAGPAAVRDGTVELLASESVVKGLGAERVIPQPKVSAVGPRGITYIFPVSETPATMSFELRPNSIGWNEVTLTAAGGATVHFPVLVLP